MRKARASRASIVLSLARAELGEATTGVLVMGGGVEVAVPAVLALVLGPPVLAAVSAAAAAAVVVAAVVVDVAVAVVVAVAPAVVAMVVVVAVVAVVVVHAWMETGEGVAKLIGLAATASGDSVSKHQLPKL